MTATRRGTSGKQATTKNSKTTKKLSNISFVDLCCGLGGLSLAAEQLGKVVAGVDLNACALKTFSRNFPDAKAILGSVRSKSVMSLCRELLAKSRESENASVVVSGPPCQGFSVAGPRNPSDVRNQILVAVARAISDLQPTCALIENVSMVLANQHDDRLARLEKILSEGGYSVTSVLLDASEFGVSQRRKRAFFLVTRTPVRKEAILQKLEKYKCPAKGTQDVLNDLPKALIRPNDYDDEIDYGGVANHIAMQHSQRVIDKISKIAPGTGPMSYRRLHPTRPSNTLFSGHRAPPAHYHEARSITVREAARLQGFPDDFRIYGSFANQMGQVTNAVPPPLAAAVLNVLLDLSQINIA